MKKVIDFIKKAYKLSVKWIKANGVTGIFGLILGFGLWIAGYQIIAGFCFGVFATRNWDILVNYINEILESKI